MNLKRFKEISVFPYQTPQGIILGKDLGLESLFIAIIPHNAQLTEFILSNNGKKKDDKKFSMVKNLNRLEDFYLKNLGYFPTTNNPYTYMEFHDSLTNQIGISELKILNGNIMYRESKDFQNKGEWGKLQEGINLRETIYFFNCLNYSFEKEKEIKNNITHLRSFPNIV